MVEKTALAPKTGGLYSHYVLAVLVIVYIFNFIDRNILSILAEDIKADLGVTDAQMGFLYGTVFAVFYAIFGIPLARLADVWVRVEHRLHLQRDHLARLGCGLYSERMRGWEPSCEASVGRILVRWF